MYLLYSELPPSHKVDVKSNQLTEWDQHFSTLKSISQWSRSNFEVKEVVVRGRVNGQLLPLPENVVGDVDGIKGRAEEAAAGETDAVEPLLPLPTVGEGSLGDALLCEVLVSILSIYFPTF